jgi:hypothetical protein
VIVFLLFLHIIPPVESVRYETNDGGKIGSLVATSYRDSLGYHVSYISDREITILLDATNLSTLYARKVIDGELVFEFERASKIDVFFNGREYSHNDKSPVYDRHTLDFALRGFEYHGGFKTMFRLHIPELTIVNAELEVLAEEEVITPVGSFECWKVQMKPRVIFFNRRFFFFIEKDYPHRFIKYTDSSGKNSITLIEYQNGVTGQ